MPAAWLGSHGGYSGGLGRALYGALHLAICADLVRQSLPWFTAVSRTADQVPGRFT